MNQDDQLYVLGGINDQNYLDYKLRVLEVDQGVVTELKRKEKIR